MSRIVNFKKIYLSRLDIEIAIYVTTGYSFSNNTFEKLFKEYTQLIVFKFDLNYNF